MEDPLVAWHQRAAKATAEYGIQLVAMTWNAARKTAEAKWLYRGVRLQANPHALIVYPAWWPVDPDRWPSLIVYPAWWPVDPDRGPSLFHSWTQHTYFYAKWSQPDRAFKWMTRDIDELLGNLQDPVMSFHHPGLRRALLSQDPPAGFGPTFPSPVLEEEPWK